ncbi:DNA primase [Dissulfurirhabdus thermomarina]|uniref:DNA primase n=1 Tax=Dissulfurirhabdus thermomarina TaxID=1765737 RepID=A0A6N9TJL1_DISTH|nr:phage/plasmid primase, P4 family [Dissulfurirhabdus thermomarina]NDY41269.1 DNA primase [Dissulfurirhabdus thermomarina]
MSLDPEFVQECLRANELGDGLLYAAIHQGRYVYASNQGLWYRWDGHSWARDDLDQAVAAVEDVAAAYADEIQRLGADLAEALAQEREGQAAQLRATIKALRRRIDRLRTDAGRRNCLRFAAVNPSRPLAIRGDEFDRNPWLLAVANGVVDLRSGEIEPGRQEDYIARRSPVVWPEDRRLEDLEAPLWEQTLEEIYGDEEIVSYLQRLFGYAIAGRNSEHIFPIFWGRGRNGKSLMVETLHYVLGGYAGSVPAEMLLDVGRPTSSAQSSPDLMSLKGLRLAIASETDEGRRFSISRVKWLTGGDTLTARGLYERHMTEWEPTHLLVLLTNNRPAASGDYAFWSRCQLIPHPHSFVPDPRSPHERPADPNRAQKLREEAAGILAWLIRGCLEWQQVGLRPPESVQVATQEYADEEDYVGRFLEACTEVGDGYRVSASDLYAAFSLWYQGNVSSRRSYTPSQKSFTSKVHALDRYQRIKSNGYYHFLGLRLTEEWAARIREVQPDDT